MSPLHDLLACPADLEPLQHDVEGASCPACGRRFPLVEGILCLLPDQLCARQSADAAWQAKQSEQSARDAQADDYDRMLGLRLLTAWERPAVLRRLHLQPGQVVLEAGCGTGRITAALARRSRVVALDFSLESLRRNRHKLAAAGIEALLVQADLNHVPLRPQSVDAVVSCQVLEHLPGEEARTRAVAELARVLRPGGRLAISAYHYNLATRWFGAQEGQHPGGIYYHRFTRREYRELLEKCFTLDSVSAVGGYVLLAAGRKPEVVP